MSKLRNNVVLDEDAFSEAIADFESLSKKIRQLNSDVGRMLDILKKGFDTPAGVKFINSCEENLKKPLDGQRRVVRHISSTLKEAKASYKSVFDEYEALQKEINNTKI